MTIKETKPKTEVDILLKKKKWLYYFFQNIRLLLLLFWLNGVGRRGLSKSLGPLTPLILPLPSHY